MVLGGTSQIHATPLYSFSNERDQILACCQVAVTYNFIVGEGDVLLHRPADELREENGKSVEELFKGVFKC